MNNTCTTGYKFLITSCPVPPEKDSTLPDLYRLMDSLEDGQTDLDKEEEPPSLFTRQETADTYHKITELKMELEEEPIGDYVEDFEEGVRDDVLMIGSISLEEVQVIMLHKTPILSKFL